MAAKKTNSTTSFDVLLYIPNLIGYSRVLFVIASFYYAFRSWKIAVSCYIFAFVGDVVDGYAARACKQCSIYGGHLDMITDRVSTCGFLIIVSHLYPTYAFGFIMLVVLDISSHWFHVMSVTAHHKSSGALLHRNAILQWYYSIYPLFGYCCVGTELFYILLYVLHHFKNADLEMACYYICFPACILKQIVNVIQLFSAMEAIAAQDAMSETQKVSATISNNISKVFNPKEKKMF